MSKYTDDILSMKDKSIVDEYKLGIEGGRLLALSELMIEILTHNYTVNEIKGAIDNARDKITLGEG